jgi:leader peptidase (prepilin peptidase)/N-methyltransferase
MSREPSLQREAAAFSGPVWLVLLSIVAALIVGAVYLYGYTASAVAYSFFIFVGVWLSAIDLRLRILPNRIVVPSIGIGLVLLLVATVVDEGAIGQGDVTPQAVRVVLGGIVLFVVFLGLALISPRGLGMGDVKFAAFIGIYLAFEGWRTLLLGAAAGFICAAVAGIALLILKRTTLRATIPFGPMMFCGALAAIAL